MDSYSMIEPKLYQQANMESQYIARALSDNLRLLKWKPEGGDLVLDVGCGPGQVTTEVLIPSLPENIKTLTACDISETMLNFAQANHSHSKVNYVQLDIGVDIPNEFKQKFDHIFSFYCIQYVQDQRKVFKNLFELLTPGGDMLIIPIADASTYQAHQKMSCEDKWKQYLHNYTARVSPYHNLAKPSKIMEEHLIATGFQVRLIEVVDTVCPFPGLAIFNGLVKAVDPFLDLIPEELHDDYINDIVNLHPIRTDDKGETSVDSMMKLVIIVAGKPK